MMEPTPKIHTRDDEHRPSRAEPMIDFGPSIESPSMPHDDLDKLASESNDVVRIERLTHHIQRIRENMDDLKNSMSRMADAMTRLALIEERQVNTNSALERMGRVLDDLESRVSELEVKQPLHSKTTEWFDKAMWAVLVGAFMLVAAKVGLI